MADFTYVSPNKFHTVNGKRKFVLPVACLTVDQLGERFDLLTKLNRERQYTDG